MCPTPKELMSCLQYKDSVCLEGALDKTECPEDRVPDSKHESCICKPTTFEYRGECIPCVVGMSCEDPDETESTKPGLHFDDAKIRGEPNTPSGGIHGGKRGFWQERDWMRDWSA